MRTSLLVMMVVVTTASSVPLQRSKRAPQFPSLPNFDLETINNAISSLTQIRNRPTSTTTTTTTTTTPAPFIPEPADIGARLGEVGLQVANNIFDPCEVQERGARRFVSRIVGGVNTVLGVNPCL